ncbi:MAG: hypothetical protein IH946_06120 [Bacteroidetes bacterium]|nr:hypothetical protein [Bacteroidota bacterium]
MHRSYAVNTRFIDQIQHTQLLLGDHSIPISRKYKQVLLDKYIFF